MSELYNNTTGITTAGLTPTTILGRGAGIGPGDTSLWPLFQGNLSYYTNLLQGTPTSTPQYAGRYADLSSGTAAGPGVVGQVAALSANKWYDFSSNYWQSVYSGQQTDTYGSPPDTRGYGAVALDPTGCPLFFNMGETIINYPYDFDSRRNAAHGLPAAVLGNNAPPDDAFGPAELERVLRPFDRDSSLLPSRLLALTGGNNSPLLTKNYEVTTEQWDLPCPAVVLPKALRPPKTGTAGLSYYPQHIVDLLNAYQIPQNGWLQLGAAEMLAGLKLNLNRPLGILGLPTPAGSGVSNGTWQANFQQYVTTTTTTSLRTKRQPAVVQLRPHRREPALRQL